MVRWGTKSKEAKAPVKGPQRSRVSGGWEESKPVRQASVSPEAIAQRAYEKWVARGGSHGNDRKDWLEAERELLAEVSKN